MIGRIMSALALVAGFFASGFSAQATTLEKFGLGDLVSRSDTVFRGTVMDVEQQTIEIGGGQLPMVKYTLRVDDLLKGQADYTKGDISVIEVQMIGSIKDAESRDDGLVRLSVFRDVPKLTRGSDYVLFMTPKSSVGLNVTVGLGQGAFDIFRQNKQDYAVNQFNNQGLGVGEDGPMTYDSLKAAISSALGQ